MRHPLPPIPEEGAARKERLHHAHDGPQKPRLPMLYWLASRQAHTRQDVACLRGVHRHTMSRWGALYATGGLAALLAPAVLTSLRPALHRAEGFAAYEALPRWVRQTHGVEVTDNVASGD